MRGWWLGAFALTLSACATSSTKPEEPGAVAEITPATQLSAPPMGNVSDENRGAAQRGRYMVELLGCGSCHTDGALIGAPRADRALAGSQIGIAYTSPLEEDRPGVVYGANLTPDVETGIGAWTDEELVRMVRTGLDRHGRQQLPVMPWPVYSRLSDEDARAIVTYLKSLDPIVHDVPDPVAPGDEATAPYVHFGVYTYEKE